MSPTQRSLKFLRNIGFKCHVVERWNQYARVRQDAFGFGDILIVHPDCGIILVQCCAGASHAARREKIIHEPLAASWLKAGGRIEVMSWAKQGARGQRKLWTSRRENVTLDMMVAAEDSPVAAA